MKERWKPVVGYEGFYEVSDRGRVRALRRYINNHVYPAHMMTGSKNPHNGYLTVCLSKLGKQKTERVHTLVLSSFVGPRPTGTEACHGDGNRLNACLSNLRWDSCSANQQDRIRHGTMPRGEAHPKAVFTEKDVLEIRKRRERGETLKSIACDFCVHLSTIFYIVKRQRWAHL